MPSPEIEELARMLVHQVRDVAIRSCDALLQAQAASPTARRWKALAATPTEIAVVIPDAVDEAIFAILSAIDQNVLRLKYRAGNGHEIDLNDEGMGELGGWYIGTWRMHYSAERVVDDFADLRK